jgi:CheY-like chemotaxis protein
VVEPTDINDIVRSTSQMFGRTRKQILIYVNFEERIWPVNVDQKQVEQVLLNMYINAWQAMPQGGELHLRTGNIILDEQRSRLFDIKSGNYVRIIIKDTGIGMDHNTLPRIFEPFFTTKERGEGTGLGLATVYGIVKQSEGNIWVYSEEGVGTTFKIYLPRARGQAKPLTRPEVGREMPSEGETILLVEDEARVRDLARLVLQRQGYTVLEAADGQEALRLAAGHSGPIHLLLTDVVMPGMSGMALAEGLGQTHPDLKILFTSGYTDIAIAHQGVLEPGVAFLQKPFSPLALARKVRAVLDT